MIFPPAPYPDIDMKVVSSLIQSFKKTLSSQPPDPINHHDLMRIKLIKVQPMTVPAGGIFYMDYEFCSSGAANGPHWWYDEWASVPRASRSSVVRKRIARR